jgi:hypothetical protein
VSPFGPSFSPQPRVYPPSPKFCAQPRAVSDAVSYSCGLFGLAKKVNPFVIKQIRTLCAKHPGWGYLRFPAVHGSPVTAHGSRFCPPFAFINLRTAPSHPSICNILYFMRLQIPFFASHLFSKLSALPPVFFGQFFSKLSVLRASAVSPLLQFSFCVTACYRARQQGGFFSCQ